MRRRAAVTAGDVCSRAWPAVARTRAVATLLGSSLHPPRRRQPVDTRPDRPKVPRRGATRIWLPGADPDLAGAPILIGSRAHGRPGLARARRGSTTSGPTPTAPLTLITSPTGTAASPTPPQANPTPQKFSRQRSEGTGGGRRGRRGGKGRGEGREGRGREGETAKRSSGEPHATRGRPGPEPGANDGKTSGTARRQRRPGATRTCDCSMRGARGALTDAARLASLQRSTNPAFVMSSPGPNRRGSPAARGPGPGATRTPLPAGQTHSSQPAAWVASGIPRRIGQGSRAVCYLGGDPALARGRPRLPPSPFEVASP